MQDEIQRELIQTAAVTVSILEQHFNISRTTILQAISDERQAQDRKWGSQAHLSLESWATILGEEYGEVCKAIIEERARDESGS